MWFTVTGPHVSKYGLHKTQVAYVKMLTFTYESHGLYSLAMSPLVSKTLKNDSMIKKCSNWI